MNAVTTIEPQVLRLLDEVLSLRGRGLAFTRETHLMGAVPELDSFTVVNLITALEETFGVSIADEGIDGGTFATVGSLVDFVQAQLPAGR